MDTPTPKEVIGSGAIVEGVDTVTAHGIVLSAPRTGFVALLDVLGFRSLITHPAGAGWVADYLGIVDYVLGMSDVEGAIFSDSIVLTKDGSDEMSLHAICRTCAMLMYNLLEKNTPVRGAISYGSFYRTRALARSVFVAGRPIVEAFEYEKKQDWVGVMLAPSALRAPHGINWDAVGFEKFSAAAAHENMVEHMRWKALVQRNPRIPVHSESPGLESTDGYAIVPCPTSTVSQISMELHAMVQKLDYLKLNAPTPKDQRKYSGALEWLNVLLAEWAPRAASYANYKL